MLSSTSSHLNKASPSVSDKGFCLYQWRLLNTTLFETQSRMHCFFLSCYTTVYENPLSPPDSLGMQARASWCLHPLLGWYSQGHLARSTHCRLPSSRRYQGTHTSILCLLSVLYMFWCYNWYTHSKFECKWCTRGCAKMDKNLRLALKCRKCMCQCAGVRSMFSNLPNYIQASV